MKQNAMKSARPFLIALTPLLIGLAVYYVYWRREADGLADAVEEVAGNRPDVSGFPYRLSADLPEIDVQRGGDAADVRLTAGHSQIGSGPFRANLYVGYLTDVNVRAAAAGIGDINLTGADAQASLRAGDVIERLSVRFEKGEVRTSLLAAPVHAAPVEFHFRETPNPTPSADATGPAQAEARIAGTFDLTDRRVGLSLPIKVTADAPLMSLAAWKDGGTIEIDGGTISAADGAAVAGFDVTIVPLAEGGVQLAGTLNTDCPATVQALVDGKALPQQEFRQRRPAKFALGGTPTAISLRRLETASGGSVRSREPPCPDLRR